jgi:hypothetical protein
MKKLGVASHKKITLFSWKDVKTSLVHLELRFIPLNYYFLKFGAVITKAFYYRALQSQIYQNSIKDLICL